MNKLLKYALMACVAFVCASCVQDLNAIPIDEKSETGFNQDAIFTKIYATLATTGQNVDGKIDESGDITGIDEGTSAFYRMMWELNEFPSDEGWWIWEDPGVAEMRTMEWLGDNYLVKGLYYRYVTDIKYCNHFLANAESTSAKGAEQCAEVRFIRALNYWYLLDMFKFIPFSAKESTDPKNYPDYLTRAELFEWLEKELKELTVILPAQRLGKYRVDQTAAWILLGRMYLNAKVYIGEEKWQEAKTAADNALSNSYYQLFEESVTNKDGIVYSPYQQLFMGDNDRENTLNNNPGPAREAVLLVYQDGNYCRCWGGSMFVIASVRDAGMIPWGVTESWNCIRTSPEFVYKFKPEDITTDSMKKIKADEYHMPIVLGDDRAILCSYVAESEKSWKLVGGKTSSLYDSWSCPKFTAVYSTSDSLKQVRNSHSQWPDTDVPLIRIAEAYMTKAEAMLRLGDNGGAMQLINDKIRSRAHAKPLTSLDEDIMLDEWSREFWGEGRRRTDLVRFNRFAGAEADASGYTWEGRPGKAAEKYNWFPVPSDDKKTNPNFKLQVESKPDALPGGDGYTYAD